MSLRAALFVALLGCSICSIIPGVSAATKKKTAEKPDPALEMVQQVLRAEVAGQVDRRRVLSKMLEKQPDSSIARWQAGYVRDGGGWRSFDEAAPSSSASELFHQYRLHRDDAPPTFEGQMDMADWCRRKGLKDRERAHLFAALAKAPEQNQPALLERLGYARSGTQWVSTEQIRDWEQTARRSEESLKKWLPKLMRSAQRLAGTKPQHDVARAELRAIRDPSAVPAIELILAGGDVDAASEAVEVLRRIEGPEAALVLAKLGVFGERSEIRTSAAGALEERRLDDFVPGLISLLATPAQAEWRFFHDAFRNMMFYTYVVTVEKENHIELASSQLVQQGVVVPPVSGQIGSPQWGLSADSDALRDLKDRLFSRDRRFDGTNELISELNQRVISVLASVTGNEPSPDARVWWQWWSDHSDVQSPETKPVTVVVRETESLATPYREVRAECFVAGTPVWTEAGPQSIETIRIGDRVLSQDIETGELGYKPVLHTTVRPPKELSALRFGEETIVCTGGHRFWTSGSGWTRARDLAPQTLLRTVTGNTPVWTAKKGSTAETYNLVVADFHTYFAGKTGVLCQDVLMPKPTRNVVPGLPRSIAAAQTAK